MKVESGFAHELKIAVSVKDFAHHLGMSFVSKAIAFWYKLKLPLAKFKSKTKRPSTKLAGCKSVPITPL
jgi:hypothetical protein